MTVDENLFLLFQRSNQRIGKYLHWIHSAHCKFISFVVYDQRLTHFWFICFLCCFLAFAPFCFLMAGEWEFGFVRSPFFRVFKINSPEANNQLDRNYFNAALPRSPERFNSLRFGFVGSGFSEFSCMCMIEAADSMNQPNFYLDTTRRKICEVLQLKAGSGWRTNIEKRFAVPASVEIYWNDKFDFHRRRKTFICIISLEAHFTLFTCMPLKCKKYSKLGLPLMTKACQAAVAKSRKIDSWLLDNAIV